MSKTTGTLPFRFDVLEDSLSQFDNKIERYLSNMRGMYRDADAYQTSLDANDALIYEVYEIDRPEIVGELRHGMTVLHAGRVGDEYFMTKGHFHTVLETGEVYYALRGSGMMVMETPEGETSVVPMHAGSVVYVPPRWAHRTVNTHPTDDLVFFFVYPGNAGHDYGTIETRGFRKLVVQRDDQPTIIDNPRWA